MFPQQTSKKYIIFQVWDISAVQNAFHNASVLKPVISVLILLVQSYVAWCKAARHRPQRNYVWRYEVDKHKPNFVFNRVKSTKGTSCSLQTTEWVGGPWAPQRCKDNDSVIPVLEWPPSPRAAPHEEDIILKRLNALLFCLLVALWARAVTLLCMWRCPYIPSVIRVPIILKWQISAQALQIKGRGMRCALRSRLTHWRVLEELPSVEKTSFTFTDSEQMK